MKRVLCLAITVVVVVAAVITDAVSQNQEGELEVVVEPEEDQDGELTMTDGSAAGGSTDKVFIPTDEWQTLETGQAIPRGLHVRMNLQTGVKEAKLLDDNEEADDANAPDVAEGTQQQSVNKAVIPLEKNDSDDEAAMDPKAELMRENIIEALKQIKSEDGLNPEESIEIAQERKKKLRTYEEIKENFDALNIKIETDVEILTKLMNRYENAKTDKDRASLLEDLEYLVHQFDNAITFVDMGGLQQIVLPGINSTSIDIKQKTFHLLGSAVQSNPKVQIASVELGLVESLIRAVTHETEVSVARKAVFALSCLVRGFPYGQQVLVQNGGLEVLRKVFDRGDFQTVPLQLKVVALLHDLLIEREEAEGERLQQLRLFKLDEQLAVGGWCPVVSSLLTVASFDRRDRRYDMGAALKNEMPLRPDHDTVDKVVSAMSSMVEVCRYQFFDTLPLLRHLAHTYDDLAYKEQFQDNDDGGHALFKGLAETIQRLVRKIGLRNEL
ncbi:nucleotide exchange factor SIL1-like isoform X2 [Eriocheir sinensis]|uniref:nucleotide exchange factor SIL1-like isoform X2 n=1 Tax=Eriocheir sinensis TaxID=95602 RepID=UPI0021C8E728|nr:nucleotide exchange factor SIL1-like isoform X2 [Eriocheir sinensis]